MKTISAFYAARWRSASLCLLSASQASINAGQAAGGAGPDRQRRHRRRRHRPEGTGGRRLGHRGDDRTCRRSSSRSSSPTIAAATCVPDLPKANYNVWVRGYGLVDSPKVQAAPGQDAEPDGGRRRPIARAAARVLSGRLLVLADPGAGEERVPRHRPGGNGISPNMKSQAEWLRQLKSGGCTACHQLGHEGHARDPEGARHLPFLGGGVGAAHPVRPGRRADGRRHEPAWARSARWRCSPTGPIGSPRANCRRRRRGRRASSATSSSRSGTGPTRRRTCTTRSRPTGAIRRSTPTA